MFLLNSPHNKTLRLGDIKVIVLINMLSWLGDKTQIIDVYLEIVKLFGNGLMPVFVANEADIIGEQNVVLQDTLRVIKCIGAKLIVIPKNCCKIGINMVCAKLIEDGMVDIVLDNIKDGVYTVY